MTMRSLSAIVATATLLYCAATAGGQAVDVWAVTVVSQHDLPTAISLTSSNYPAVVSVSADEYAYPYVSEFDGQSWTTSQASFDYADPTSSVSLCYDSSARPFVSYHRMAWDEPPYDSLAASYRENSVWNATIVEIDGSAFKSSLIRVGAGNAAIAYDTAAGSEVRVWFREFISGAWSAATLLDEFTGPGGGPVLASDPNGQPAVAYAGPLSGENGIWYGVRYDGNWAITRAADIESSYLCTRQLTFAPNGQPVILVSDMYDPCRYSYYVSRESGSWQATMIHEFPDIYAKQGFCILPNGQPVVVGLDENPRPIPWMLMRFGQTWVPYEITFTTSLGDPSDVAVLVLPSGIPALAAKFVTGVGYAVRATVPCRGDANGDGARTYADIDAFVAALGNNYSNWAARFIPNDPPCSFENCDVNGDGTVSYPDIDALVSKLGQACP